MMGSKSSGTMATLTAGTNNLLHTYNAHINVDDVGFTPAEAEVFYLI